MPTDTHTDAPGGATAAREGPPPEPPEVVFGPPSGWHLLDVAELWRFRDLLLMLVWRDVKVRYKQTVLGAAWAVLQPMLLMAVFWLLLGRLAKVDTGAVPYPLFVYAGLLPWYLFAATVGGAANSVIESERLITKVYMPRQLIVFAAAGAPLLDFLVSLGVLFVLAVVTGVLPAATLPLAALAVVVVLLVAVGAGMLLAALNVKYRDFRVLVPFLIQLGLFSTPSIYLTADAIGGGAIPEPVRTVMQLNPLTGAIEFFRAAVFGDPLPWAALGYAAGCGAVVFLVGCGYFRRTEDSFADVI